MNYAERAREIIGIEIDGLRKVQGGLDAAFDAAVRELLACVERGGKVVITGMGKSLHIGLKLAATFSSTGTPAATLHPSEAMHGDLGILGERDALLALSYSGASDELLALVPLVKRIGLPILSLTGEVQSALAQQSDVVIPVTVEREACPFNMAPTASTTAMLAVGDALAMVVLEARGFRREDYAKLHPGGAIGRTLLNRVSDIMRAGDRLAKVGGATPVREAVLTMTRCRSGSVAVVDGDDRLIGIFTDGDLRRHFADLARIEDLPVREVMSADPFRVHVDALAVDVLRMYEQHAIDDLVVVDSGDRVVGLIDVQDLPRLKIL
jgi:arabinose-5-phosphate isomerase